MDKPHNVTAKCINAKCDFCDATATWDAKTIYGPWAYLCDAHFEKLGSKLPGQAVRLEPVVQASKKCSLCGQEKPLDQYYKYVDGRGVLRYRTECIACNLAEKKKRRFKKA